jgi:DNA-binding GntR family transcriptional regulator
LKIGIDAMTKTVQVYNILKEFIFKNQILPGERIYLENLSTKLNISPTPLREALNRLVQEDYFSHSSNRGYTLRVIANSDVEKFYEFCEAIETYAIERATNNITPADLAEFRENLTRYKESIEGNYSRQRFLINNEFHLKIATLSGNKIIVENLKQILEKLIWKWKLENIVHGRGPQAYDEHMAIYISLENRDVQGAVNHLRNHIINTKNSVMKMLDMRENLFVGSE